MGTSSSNGGPGNNTPLVPSWADGGIPTPSPSPQPPPEGPPDGAAPQAPPDRPTPPAPPEPYRFAQPRANLTRFARSGGTDRPSLGRAVSQYVSRATGGARSAAQRMGASRSTGSQLLRLLVDARQQGAVAALRTLNLEALAGRPVAEVLSALLDQLCPDGGSVDEGIAREALVETIVDLEEAGIDDFDKLTPDQMQTVFELYVTHAIEGRISNDIGMNIVTLPADPRAAAKVEAELRDFIQRGVSDALHHAREELDALTPPRVAGFVDRIYESAFSLLKALGDAESEG